MRMKDYQGRYRVQNKGARGGMDKRQIKYAQMGLIKNILSYLRQSSNIFVSSLVLTTTFSGMFGYLL